MLDFLEVKVKNKYKTEGMDEIYKTIKYRGYVIEIVYDTDPESPRMWDNVGTIYSNHRNYNPDGHTLDELLENPDYQNEDGNFDQEKLDKDYIWLKIYAYIHGGITIRCGSPYGCPWDSGLFGIIAVTKEDAMKKFGLKGERAYIEEILSGEIKDLDDYYTGNVYGFRIVKEDEMIDSCYGYYGDDGLKDLEAECKSIIDNRIRENRRDRIKYLRKRIKEKGKQLCLPMFVI